MSLRRLLSEIRFQQHEVTKIWVDNKSVIELAINPVYNERSKHIDVRFHFIREHVKEKRSYMFTKPLPNAVFEFQRTIISMNMLID